MENSPFSTNSDIIERILFQAHWIDILRCRIVCRLWNSMISSSTAIRYMVWLGIHGKEDGDGSSHHQTSAERLALLLDHERSWATLQARFHSRHQFDENSIYYPCGSDVVFVGKQHPPPQRGFEGVLRHLPSTIAPNGDPRDEKFVGDFGLYTCWVDVENDLVVTRVGRDSMIKLHIRCLHAPHADHPLAQEPTIDLKRFLEMPHGRFDRSNSRSGYGFLMITSGPYLIVQHSLTSYSSSGSDNRGLDDPLSAYTILVLSWITGEVLAVSFASAAKCKGQINQIPSPQRCVFPWRRNEYDEIKQFCLISPTVFVVPEVRWIGPVNQERRYKLSISLHAFDFSKSSTTDELGCPVPTLIGIFLLPVFEDQDRGCQLTIKLGCSVTRREMLPYWPSSSKGPVTDKPFHPHHQVDDKIFTISVQLDSNERNMLFMTYTRSLLVSNSVPTNPVPWDMWGKAHGGCLWIPRDSVVATYGQRVAIVSCRANRWRLQMELGWTLELLDLNRARTSRLVVLQSSNDDDLSPSDSHSETMENPAASESGPPTLPMMWPPPIENLDDYDQLTLRIALHSPIDMFPHSSQNISLDVTAGTLRFAHNVMQLPGLRRCRESWRLGLDMDAERIILTMPHVVDRAEAEAEDEPGTDQYGDVLPPTRPYMEIFAF
ncbi:hypothetical protein DL93DRAFT_499651 [Clavulina sp. PMI_390]|nr:hypothetical protein DL93DRAFT_499651 [Clavulina sp. PMI_390]